MGVIAFVRRTPSAALLVAQLGGVLPYPFMEDSTAGRAAFAIFGIMVLSLVAMVVTRLIGLPAMRERA